MWRGACHEIEYGEHARSSRRIDADLHDYGRGRVDENGILQLGPCLDCGTLRAGHHSRPAQQSTESRRDLTNRIHTDRARSSDHGDGFPIGAAFVLGIATLNTFQLVADRLLRP